MATKVEAALIASAAGIPTVVADAASAPAALAGNPVGTYFAAHGRGPRPGCCGSSTPRWPAAACAWTRVLSRPW